MAAPPESPTPPAPVVSPPSHPVTPRARASPSHFGGDVNSPVEFPPPNIDSRLSAVDESSSPLNSPDVESVPRFSLEITGLSGHPSTASSRGPQPVSVTASPPAHRHTSSLPVRSDATLEISPQRPTPTTSETSQQSKSRHRWMRKVKVELYFCYIYYNSKRILPVGKNTFKI